LIARIELIDRGAKIRVITLRGKADGLLLILDQLRMFLLELSQIGELCESAQSAQLRFRLLHFAAVAPPHHR
jgi:hypothetical protein